MKFRKLPVVIEACLWTGRTMNGPQQVYPIWCHEAIQDGRISPSEKGDDGNRTLSIITLEGVMIAQPGDWIIRGVAGELYPCKPEIFMKTYEPADEPVSDVAAARRFRLEVENTLARAEQVICDIGKASVRIGGADEVTELVRAYLEREIVCAGEITDAEKAKIEDAPLFGGGRRGGKTWAMQQELLDRILSDDVVEAAARAGWNANYPVPWDVYFVAHPEQTKFYLDQARAMLEAAAKAAR